MALPVVLWEQVETVLQELLLALAAWVVALARALVALFQANHSVEPAAPLDFRAWRVASLLLLVLFQILETREALQAAWHALLLALLPLAQDSVAPPKDQVHYQACRVPLDHFLVQFQALEAAQAL